MRHRATLFVVAVLALAALAWLLSQTPFLRAELPANTLRNTPEFLINQPLAQSDVTAQLLPQVVAAPNDCDLQLNFHGQPNDFLRVQYWQQRLTEIFSPVNLSSQQPLSEPPSLSFCASLQYHLYSDDCPEQEGRAWCRPLPQDSTLAANNTFASSALELTVPGGAMEEASFTTAGFIETSAKPQLDVVLTDSGLANTRNGVVFLQRSASVHVLKHEFGHALGLADEYPMHPELARLFCNGEFNFAARNLVITGKTWLTPQEMRIFQQSLPWRDFVQQPLGAQDSNGLWRLGSADNGEVGLFPASTCEGTGRYAWKPVANKTWMEQHQIGEIPALYIHLIQKQLKDE